MVQQGSGRVSDLVYKLFVIFEQKSDEITWFQELQLGCNLSSNICDWMKSCDAIKIQFS